MAVNPQTLTWQAPTENVDGTPIDYELVYDLGVTQGGLWEVIAQFPGTLNPDGTYSAPLADFAFEDGEHTIGLRSVRADLPSLVSEWSNTVTFEVENDTPNPPAALAVE